MRIGLDFDGVISDCGGLKCEATRRLFGVDIPPAKFKKEIVIGEGLLTLEQYREMQRVIYGTHEYGQLMAPVPGMVDGISRLRAQGHDLRIITSRDGVQLEVAKAWMDRHGIDLHVTGVGYGVSKASAAEGLDLFVDDDLDKLEPLVEIVPHRVLFSWDYNGHIDASQVAVRVASWNELVDRVTALHHARTPVAAE